MLPFAFVQQHRTVRYNALDAALKMRDMELVERWPTILTTSGRLVVFLLPFLLYTVRYNTSDAAVK